MWGSGGRLYWGRKERGEGAHGIAVLFAGIPSEERDLKPFVDLYGSLGWNSLVCHVDFLTLFTPEKAASLATGILNELVQQVKVRPLPIVLISFSGGSKGCLYKVLQLVEGKCGGHPTLDGYQLIIDCICGQIYDSGPVDFTSDVHTQFYLQSSILKKSHPPRLASWMAKVLASGLDTFFLNRSEAQRAEYWQTLYSSANMGPFLILCSEEDDLAPYHIICNFAQRLQDLGGDVKLVKWNSSPHIAHYEHHQDEYRASVAEFLTKATVIYSQRRRLNEEKTSRVRNSNSVINLNNEAAAAAAAAAAASSTVSQNKVDVGPNEHFFPSSMEFGEIREAESSGEQRGDDPFHLPSFNPNGILSQILFDVCVPRNVEGWDIKPGMSSTPGQRHGPFNPLKYIRRSRL